MKYIKNYYMIEILILFSIIYLTLKVNEKFDLIKQYCLILQDQIEIVQLQLKENENVKETTEEKIEYLDEKDTLKYKTVQELKTLAIDKYNIPKEKLNKIKKDELIQEIENCI